MVNIHVELIYRVVVEMNGECSTRTDLLGGFVTYHSPLLGITSLG